MGPKKRHSEKYTTVYHCARKIPTKIMRYATPFPPELKLTYAGQLQIDYRTWFPVHFRSAWCFNAGIINALVHRNLQVNSATTCHHPTYNWGYETYPYPSYPVS